jgi:TolA-binding protein
VAEGTGLAAQNGLFALAQLQRDEDQQPEAALATFGEYRRRFPQGAFGSEAALGELDLLLRLGRIGEAASAAHAFAEANPTDPRREPVRLIEADLLRVQRDLERANAIYRELAQASARREVREEALFQLALSEENLGHRDGARSAFQAYQQQFPQGVHAGEVAAHLHP